MDQPTKSFIMIDDCKVNIHQYGNEPHQLVCVHGGPGLTFEVFEDFHKMIKRPGLGITYFDLPGSFHSDPISADQASIELFTDSVSKVIDSLSGKKVHLLGHSMGGAVAMEYAASNPGKLESLTISNWMSNMDAYTRYLKKLFDEYDGEIKDRFKELIDNQSFAEPEFQQMVFQHWYLTHICRMDPWPDAMNRALEHFNAEIFVHFCGPNPFELNGTLANWNGDRLLEKIDTPTLVIGAEYDSMDPEYFRWMAAQLPDGKYAHCDHGSHFSMFDAKDQYFDHLNTFLATRVD